MHAGDNFAVLLINGKVLVEGNSSRLYEFDGTNFTPTLYSNGGSLIVLPTGEVLVGGSEVYKATGSYLQPWAPNVLSFPSTVTRGQSYIVSGKLFNGWSQAAAFGDEFETATNYPLVRITNNPPDTSSTPRPTTIATWVCRPAMCPLTRISMCLQAWRPDQASWWW